MRALVTAVLLWGLVALSMAGSLGFGGGFGYGYGGGYGKSLPGPTFLVKTVHHVNRLSHGGNLVGAHAGSYGGGFGFGYELKG